MVSACVIVVISYQHEDLGKVKVKVCLYKSRWLQKVGT